MAQTAILRTRINPRRKAIVEKILKKLGLTPTQAINLLFAQIEQRKAIPFQIALDNNDILPSDEHYGDVMKLNDQ